jgi:uncharacterized membrane protein
MSFKLAPLLESMRANFWFVPTMLLLSTVLIAIITLLLDTHLIGSLNQYIPILYSFDVSAIRSFLGTIAAAMITVTSIAFSITIVALTLASSQFGPRLMRNFMADSTTQIVLGVFISNFLYCIIIFCALSLKEPYIFSPGISVIWAILMTCISIGYLIHFIHHVSVSIQADNVIEDVYQELKDSIKKLFPTTSAAGKKTDDISLQELGTNDCQVCEELRSKRSGYVQLIDYKSLVDDLTRADLQLKLVVSPGNYVVSGSVYAYVYSCHTVEKEDLNCLRKHLLLGSKRTPLQDPEFAVGQLVEIALRALSPGINDPFTAISCIDKLGSALCYLTNKQFPKVQWKDQNEKVRVQRKALLFIDIASAAIDQIRQTGEHNTAITIRLLELLYEVALRANNDEQYAFVYAQLDMIRQQQKCRKIANLDAQVIHQRISKLNDYLELDRANL